MRTALIWSVLLCVVLVVLISRNQNESAPSQVVTGKQALDAIDDGRVQAYQIRDGDLVLIDLDGHALSVQSGNMAPVSARLAELDVPYVFDEPRFQLTELLTWLLAGAVVLVALIFFLRKMRGNQMNNIFELRKTKARPVEEHDKARFTDIGGNEEAVELLADLVDFLRSPQRWTAAGTRIPRGILLVGPPGVGKTLLARAVAGETESTFLYTSAAEFVEMFVGVGAARVRDTFEKAAAQQPAVIFIDELDAIGRRRGTGLGTMHEEREQTLNQLLVLMDGLERHERVVAMAATNRPDVLDPALLRSGRFDRVVRLQPPSKSERLEILKIHTRNKPLATDVALENLAAVTDGCTGADLEAICNDAALLGVRRSRKIADEIPDSVSLTHADFQQALQSIAQGGRQFDRLDTLLVESVSQFAEPTGRAVARLKLSSGSTLEGEVLWMNVGHVKIRTNDGSEIIVAKDTIEQFSPLSGTETAAEGDFKPDPWAGRNLDVG